MNDKAAYCDVDGTLASGFYIEDLCNALYKERLFSRKEYIKSEEILHEYKKGNLRYNEAASEAVKLFAKGIKGRRKADAEKVGEIYIVENPENAFPFTGGLISILRNRGYKTALLSGSPEEIIIPFSKQFNIGRDDVFATAFETDGKGLYTGEVLRSMVELGMKKSAVQNHALDHGIDLKKSAAFGDTENDIQMFELVGYPVAIKPNDKLTEIAAKNKWPICRTDEDIIEEVKYLP